MREAADFVVSGFISQNPALWKVRSNSSGGYYLEDEFGRWQPSLSCEVAVGEREISVALEDQWFGKHSATFPRPIDCIVKEATDKAEKAAREDQKRKDATSAANVIGEACIKAEPLGFIYHSSTALGGKVSSAILAN